MGGNRVFKATVTAGPHAGENVAIKQIQMSPSDKDEIKEQMQKEVLNYHNCLFSLRLFF